MVVTRLLEPRDADALVEHMRAHSAESGRDGDPIFLPWGRRRPLDLAAFRERRLQIWRLPLTLPGWGRTWGLVDGRRIVGHVELGGGVIPADLHRATLGMGLERPWRGQGHGRALLEHALEWARARGIEWIDLGVFGENVRAQALYRSVGFRETGRVPDRYRVDGVPIEDVAMSLHLDPSESREKDG